MRVPVKRSDLNIQEKLKTPNKNHTDQTAKPPGTGPPAEAKIAVLVSMLRSPHFTGEVLRVLVRRLRNPGLPYTSKELETLLLLTVALERAGMWP
jgi:hypothetical protein